MMKKCLLAICVIVSFSTASYAQVKGPDYKAGIGIRLGGGYYDAVAASLKVFPRIHSAFEFNLGIRPYNFGYTNISASASYQHHFPISNIDGFNWFIGGGATLVNTFSSDSYYRGVGVYLFPTGGAEYKFSNIPLAVSADIRPSFRIVEPYNERDFQPNNIGIAARYTFR